MDGYDETSLGKYISTGNVPPEAMDWLNKLLFTQLHDYCAECQDDRMVCVYFIRYLYICVRRLLDG